MPVPEDDAPHRLRRRGHGALEGVFDAVLATVVGQGVILIGVATAVSYGATEGLWIVPRLPGLTQFFYLVPLSLRYGGPGDHRRGGLLAVAGAILLLDAACLSLCAAMGPPFG